MPLALRQRLYRLHKSLATRDHQLLYLFLELTRRCNLACRHCGSDCGSDSSAPELTQESWLSIVRYASAAFGPDLCFVLTGGEPLLYPGLRRLCELMAELGHRWGIVTNGIALDAEMLRRLIDARLHSITVSLDGNEPAHVYLRRAPDSYRRALRAIHLVGSSPVPVRDVVTCLYPAVIDDLDDMGRLLVDSGINSWRLCRIFPAGRARGCAPLYLSRELTWKAIEWIARNRGRLRELGLNVSLGCEGWIPFAWDVRVRDAPYFCRSGINIASILCDGGITGCPNNGARFRQGNLRESDLRSVWRQGFRELRDRRWTRQGICARCADWRDCLGGPIHLWDEERGGPSFCYAREL